MIRFIHQVLCLVATGLAVTGSGVVWGQNQAASYLPVDAHFVTPFAAGNDGETEQWYGEDFVEASLVRPISFAASLDHNHGDLLRDQSHATSLASCRCKRQSAGNGLGGAGSGASGGEGSSAADATNPTASITQYQVQNTFIPSTYDATGYSNSLALLLVKPFKTKSQFFPSWITRTTLPVLTTADPDGDVPIGPPNDTDFGFNLGRQSGLGDLVFISIFNHPTDWGSWGIGPGFVAPTATRPELGEQSWKFSPTFAVVNTAIPTWQLGILGVYNFPLDSNGTKSLLFQPLIVKQLGEGWYTGWGDDLWSFNSKSGNFAMPLQLRLGKVYKCHGKQFNTFVTGLYTPDGLRKGPTPEWGIKFSVSLLKAN